jgi:hypothetical protein
MQDPRRRAQMKNLWRSLAQNARYFRPSGVLNPVEHGREGRDRRLQGWFRNAGGRRRCLWRGGDFQKLGRRNQLECRNLVRLDWQSL